MLSTSRHPLDPNPITVAIADDHALIRESAIRRLEENNEIKVLCSVGDGNQLISFLEQAPILPQMCILDIQMPFMDGFQTLVDIKENWPAIKVLILTGFPKQEYIELACAKNAAAFIAKDGDPDELRRAVLYLQNHNIYFNDLLTKERISAAVGLKEGQPLFSDKERKLMSFCASDLAYKEIGALIGMKGRSVSSAYDRLFRKTHTKTRTTLAVYAINHGYALKDQLLR